MAPIKPYAAPPLVPAKPAPAGPARQAGGDIEAGFRPGLGAPRATPRLSGLDAPRKASGKKPPPVAEGRRLFTMQALSAYAGLLLDADKAAAGNPGGVAGRPARRTTADAPRPSPPGSKLDLKV